MHSKETGIFKMRIIYYKKLSYYLYTIWKDVFLDLDISSSNVLSVKCSLFTMLSFHNIWADVGLKHIT